MDSALKQQKVNFIITKIEDIRKSGSTIEEGNSYVGTLNLNTNAVWFEDENGQSWVFWVGDTCELIPEL